MNILKDSRYGPMIIPKNDRYIGRSFDLYGEFSYQEVDFLKDLINPGDVVIDVGANIGGITVPLAQKIGPDGYMIAFEPQQYINYILCGNIALNNLENTACFQRLVCDVDGDIRSLPILDYSVEQNFGDNSTKKKFDEEMPCTPVSTCTIDSLQLTNIHLIKADVQGEELDVLKGAKKSIERTRPFLYVECEDKQESERILEFLSPFNYSCLFHTPPLFNPDNFFAKDEDVFDKVEDGIINLIVSGNIFAYPEEKTEWSKAIERNFFSHNFEG